MMENPRIYKPSSVPDAVNQERLQAEVAQLGNVGVSMMSDGLVFSVYDKAIDDSAIQAIVDAHDASVKTTGQVRSEVTDVLFDQVNKRMIEEMVKSTPDFEALYDEIADIIAGNEAIMTALNNTVALQNDVYLTGIAPKSKRAKKQALLAFIQVLSLWYEI